MTSWLPGTHRARPAVDEVAEEDRGPPRGWDDVTRFGRDRVAELGEQRDELVVAAVDVADEVERPELVAAVCIATLALHERGFDVLDAP